VVNTKKKQYGSYFVIDGTLDDTPKEIIEETKQLVKDKVVKDVTDMGEDVSLYDEEFVIKQTYDYEGHSGSWFEPLIGEDIKLKKLTVSIGYKLTER
jgi:hypothetical protein